MHPLFPQLAISTPDIAAHLTANIDSVAATIGTADFSTHETAHKTTHETADFSAIKSAKSEANEPTF